jgi:hypothetical protein
MVDWRTLSSSLKLGVGLPCMALWWASLIYVAGTPRERRHDPILVAQGMAQLAVGVYLLVTISACLRNLPGSRRLDRGGEDFTLPRALPVLTLGTNFATQPRRVYIGPS